MPSIVSKPEQGSGVSQRDRAERALVNAILSGGLEPDARLSLPGLSVKFDLGATPLREALCSLTARGLVRVTENKGFRVAQVSYGDFADITQSSIFLQKAALTRAFVSADHAWEDRVVAATNRLLRVVRSCSPLLEGDVELDAAHKDYHAALIAGCGLQGITRLHAALYDAAYRYRRVLKGRSLTNGLVMENHQRLSELVLARDPMALEEIEKHLMSTISTVYSVDHRQRNIERIAASNAVK